MREMEGTQARLQWAYSDWIHRSKGHGCQENLNNTETYMWGYGSDFLMTQNYVV